MSDGNPKYTFRIGQQELDDLKSAADDNGLDASKVMRTLAQAYNQDERMQDFVDSFYADEVASLDEFYESEVDALEDMAESVQEQAQGLEPGEVDEALADLMRGLYDRDEPAVDEAARAFGGMDSDLGVTVGRYAGKFADDYWEQELE
jgi:hypothetical protein